MIQKYASVLLSLMLWLVSVGSAQALTTGDMAFTAFNADEDGWAMVSFVDVAANTTIYFSDNEWNGSAIGNGGAFNTGESFHQWVSGATTIAAGTVIRFSAVDQTTLSSSVGSLTRATVSGSSNWGIANSNETIYAFLGASAAAPTTFIAAITNGDFAVDGSLAGTGLTAGVNAQRLNLNAQTATPDFAQYTGSRSGLTSVDAYKALVANVSNWTVDTSNGTYTSVTPDTTRFIASAVPEPSNYAMLLAGIGMLGLIVRRRTV